MPPVNQGDGGVVERLRDPLPMKTAETFDVEAIFDTQTEAASLIERLFEAMEKIAHHPSATGPQRREFAADVLAELRGETPSAALQSLPLKEVREALEEIAAEVVCPPRSLDEAFGQREALRDIAKAALSSLDITK